MRLALDLDAARRLCLLGPADRDATVLAETARVLEARLASAKLPEVRVVPGQKGNLEVRLPVDADPEAVRKLLCARGTIEFRIEVRPEYLIPPVGSRVRAEVWTGALARTSDRPVTTFPATKEGFTEFRAFEVARWRAAQGRKEPYRASDPRYRVVPKANVPLAVAEDFVVLEEPAAASERFASEALRDAHLWRGVAEDRGVAASIKVEVGAAFAKWTGRNVGLPLAFVVNGEWISSPMILSPLEGSLVIALPTPPVATAPSDQEALRILAYLESGPLRVEPRLVSYGRLDPPK